MLGRFLDDETVRKSSSRGMSSSYISFRISGGMELRLTFAPGIGTDGSWGMVSICAVVVEELVSFG